MTNQPTFASNKRILHPSVRCRRCNPEERKMRNDDFLVIRVYHYTFLLNFAQRKKLTTDKYHPTQTCL